MEVVHQSVLPDEVLDLLSPDEGQRLLIDATLGEGGHSVRFLQRFPGVRVIGIDADERMVSRAAERLAEYEERAELVHAWFDSYLAGLDPATRVHRILMDLGISMFHFAGAGRGFSFREDEPLDMRLNADTDRCAADLVNSLPESDLADIIFQYGEERLSRRISAAICRERRKERFTNAARLADVIRGAVPPSYRHGRIHPATRTFQALRIAVNSELDRLRRAIPAALTALETGGRLGIISFHSLEDRIVKHTFRDAAAQGPFSVITRKPIVPTETERAANPASRSAKFRVIERTAEGPVQLSGAEP